MAWSFWKGTFQNYFGNILATATIIIVAAVFSWRPQLMMLDSPIHTFAWIVGIYAMVLALYLVLRSRRTVDPVTNKQPEPSEAGFATFRKSEKQVLSEKAAQLGRDLFAFLREKGPAPKPPT
jgi:hypothetical protein